MNLIGHIINGVPLNQTERSAPVFNPATGEQIRQVALADKTTTQAAIAAAEAAYPAWRNTPPIKRARIMFKFKALLEAHAERLCELITDEHGKVLSDALGELQRGIENVEYATAAPELLKGEHSKNAGPAIDSWSEFQPLGVVAAITPFNFPAMVPLWMWPMAVVCGNTVVLKPSEKAPSSVKAIVELAHEAGLPKGVLNLINGDKEAVDTLLEDSRVQAVSFVGSTPIARHIYATASANGKRVQALGGAKNHAIVMPDADMDNAVNALIGAAFGSCGERCMAISVAVAVGEQTADRLAEQLRHKMAEIKVGSGRDKSSDMGPLISEAHKAKVCDYLASGIDQGAELVVDGRQQLVNELPNGYFLGPCLFDQVKPHMRIYREEIFGPVLCLVRVATLQEAMDLINNHEFGNGTCLFTRDGEAARYFGDNIQVGMVGINVPLPVPMAFHSFGGWKHSLFGDLSAYGPDAVRFYTRRKTITQRWPSTQLREGTQFAFPS